MELNPGEYLCKKCHGKGIWHGTSEHKHNMHNHSSSYAVEWVCNKCNGTGKLDWVTNAMVRPPHTYLTSQMPSHTHASLASLNNDITFSAGGAGGSEMLKISEDGFYVDGEKVEDKLKVYERFNDFLVASGY